MIEPRKENPLVTEIKKLKREVMHLKRDRDLNLEQARQLQINLQKANQQVTLLQAALNQKQEITFEHTKIHPNESVSGPSFRNKEDIL